MSRNFRFHQDTELKNKLRHMVEWWNGEKCMKDVVNSVK